MKQCPKCHKETDLFFCPSCGNIIEYPSFVKDNENLRPILEDYVKSYISKAHDIHRDIEEKTKRTKIADTIFKQYLGHISYLRKLCKTDAVNDYFSKSGSTLFEDMNKFAERCATNECQIAVVGTIKAGKSMFINAFLGKEIASTHPTPETASVTKFRFSSKGDYIKVSFYNSEEWNELWNDVMTASQRTARDDKEDFLTEYNTLKADTVKDKYIGREDLIIPVSDIEELKKKVEIYTSAKYADHYFAKEVEIGLSDFNVPTNVVFVDTPGLNDPVSYRSNLTKKYLHSASVVLLCLRSITAEITSSELNDISELFSLMRYSKERIFILGTQFDVQPDYFNFWKNVRLPYMLQWLSGKEYFGSEEEARKRILPVSAWFYSLIQRIKADRSIITDKSIKEHWKKLIDSSLNYVEKDELEDIYGEEEAKNRYKKRIVLFDENIELLENNTNIPTVREAILEGPIKNSEHIILQDIKGDYDALCQLIIEVSNGVINSKKEAVVISETGAIHTQIAELEEKISLNTKSLHKKENIINKALDELTKLSKDKINSIRK